MARGLAMPVGVDATGGTAMLEGDDEDSKIIRTAIGETDNDNAFQQNLGIGQDMVFAINSPQGQALIRARVKRVFEEFRREQRFKLVPGSLKLTEGPGEGELTAELKYLSIESDEERPRELRRIFTGTTSGA